MHDVPLEILTGRGTPGSLLPSDPRGRIADKTCRFRLGSRDCVGLAAAQRAGGAQRRTRASAQARIRSRSSGVARATRSWTSSSQRSSTAGHDSGSSPRASSSRRSQRRPYSAWSVSSAQSNSMSISLVASPISWNACGALALAADVLRLEVAEHAEPVERVLAGAGLVDVAARAGSAPARSPSARAARLPISMWRVSS